MRRAPIGTIRAPNPGNEEVTPAQHVLAKGWNHISRFLSISKSKDVARTYSGLKGVVATIDLSKLSRSINISNGVVPDMENPSKTDQVTVAELTFRNKEVLAVDEIPASAIIGYD